MDFGAGALQVRRTRGKGRRKHMAETLAFHAGGFMEGPAAVSLKKLVEDYERRLIEGALLRANGNQRRAAADLGCLPTTLNEKMRRLGMRACDRTPVEDPLSAV
jgi:DNA-binding NtrC family response regulator